jgi:hypothetical protein
MVKYSRSKTSFLVKQRLRDIARTAEGNTYPIADFISQLAGAPASSASQKLKFIILRIRVHMAGYTLFADKSHKRVE